MYALAQSGERWSVPPVMNVKGVELCGSVKCRTKQYILNPYRINLNKQLMVSLSPSVIKEAYQEPKN